MEEIEKEDIFYFYFGDDIRTSHLSDIDVYNTELKSQIFFNKNQLKFFMRKTK